MPGLEGVGTILRLGANPEVAKRFSEGQRVAFFPGKGTWEECVVVRSNSLLPVPNEISNQIAARMLINTITASIRSPPIKKGVYGWLPFWLVTRYLYFRCDLGEIEPPGGGYLIRRFRIEENDL